MNNNLLMSLKEMIENGNHNNWTQKLDAKELQKKKKKLSQLIFWNLINCINVLVA